VNNINASSAWRVSAVGHVALSQRNNIAHLIGGPRGLYSLRALHQSAKVAFELFTRLVPKRYEASELRVSWFRIYYMLSLEDLLTNTSASLISC
jgi:hypothetical protein